MSGWVDVGQRRTDRVRADLEYGRRVNAWLTQHFPELTDPEWGPHPAAIAVVHVLHSRYGKGRLTVREHGPAIRRAVERFRAELREAA